MKQLPLKKSQYSNNRFSCTANDVATYSTIFSELKKIRIKPFDANSANFCKLNILFRILARPNGRKTKKKYILLMNEK